MAWLTIIAAFLIMAPMSAWLAGAGPTVMLVINAAALVLTIRLYAVAAGIAESRKPLFLVGLFSGILGSLSVELLLHIRGAADLATAFSAYASLNAELYRLDVMSTWWPFVFIALSGLFYSGLAMLMSHLVHYRRKILGLDSQRPVK